MSKFAPDLLIDQLYRQAFTKKGRSPTLAADLVKCRRFVLDDSMAEFLVDLYFEFFLSVYRNKKPTPITLKRVHKRLDEVRWFSRLPHAYTWVEWSHSVILKRMHKYQFAEALFPFDDLNMSDAEIKPYEGERVGWLMRQHEKIETAFSCIWFQSWNDHDRLIYHPVCDMVWTTENTPSPWRLVRLEDPIVVDDLKYTSACAAASGTQGYHRDNVGYWLRHDHKADQAQQSIRDQFGAHAWFWIFLSTLNKIPLTVATQVRPSHGFVGRGAYRKYLDHHVITLRVPENRRAKIVRAIVTEIMRRRAHMVRGHWRDDWTLPKGNKSIWIGEHQRGDASLGWVDHDYQVEHPTREGASA